MTDPATCSYHPAPLTTTKDGLLESLETRSKGPLALNFKIIHSREGSHTGWRSQQTVVPVNACTGHEVSKLSRNITVIGSRYENQPGGHQETSLLNRPRTVTNAAFVSAPNESGQQELYVLLLSQWGLAALGTKVDSAHDDNVPAGTMPYYTEGSEYKGVLTLNTTGGRVFPIDIEPAQDNPQLLAQGTALSNLRRHAGVNPHTVSRIDVLSVSPLAQTDPATTLELKQNVVTLMHCTDLSTLNDNRMPDDHERSLDQQLHVVPVRDLDDTIKDVIRNGYRVTPELTAMAERVTMIQRAYAQSERSSANASGGAPSADDGLVEYFVKLSRSDTGWKEPKALTGDEDFLLPSFKKDSY